ncbi:MAG: hypothetical protein LBR29_03330 [Methylobacteriaceae bacterium]|jgi:hypothetical protein|nr:hypothetical protein [Methylobacteriaceae bacterium]
MKKLRYYFPELFLLTMVSTVVLLNLILAFYRARPNTELPSLPCHEIPEDSLRSEDARQHLFLVVYCTGVKCNSSFRPGPAGPGHLGVVDWYCRPYAFDGTTYDYFVLSRRPFHSPRRSVYAAHRGNWDLLVLEIGDYDSATQQLATISERKANVSELLMFYFENVLFNYYTLTIMIFLVFVPVVFSFSWMFGAIYTLVVEGIFLFCWWFPFAQPLLMLDMGCVWLIVFLSGHLLGFLWLFWKKYRTRGILRV